MSNFQVRPFLALSRVSAVCLSLTVFSSAAFAGEGDEAAGSVAPASSEEVTRLNESGMSLYTARDYRRAVEKFIQAYAIDHDPNLLFNIARCYEQLGDSGAAIEKYEEFVKMPGADTQGRQRAYDSLTQLRQLVAAAESAPASDTQPPAPGAESQQAAPVQGNAPEPAREQPRREGPGLLPWFLLGTGVVAAGVGTTVYVLGNADHDHVREAANYGERGRVVGMTEAEASDWIELGNQKKLYGLVGLGVGGALLATSAVFFIFGGESSEAGEPGTQVAFVPSSDGAGVLMTGSF
jgi:tetratricopeptide (TPR) repeat protein